MKRAHVGRQHVLYCATKCVRICELSTRRRPAGRATRRFKDRFGRHFGDLNAAAARAQEIGLGKESQPLPHPPPARRLRLMCEGCAPAQQLAKWTEADQKKVDEWKNSRVTMYAEGKMRDKHPTQEGFDAWVEKQCASSKNKAIAARVGPRVIAY